VINKKATADDLEDFNAAIIATGSKPFVPPIDGLEDYFWADILEKENIPQGERVMVIGGGLVGVETAKSLANNDNDVILVELLPELAGNMVGLERTQLMKALKKMDNVEINTGTNLTRVDGDTAYGEKDGRDITWENLDKYVVVTGVNSHNPIDTDSLDIPAKVVGDAREPAKAKEAIKSGYEAGAEI